MPVTLQLAGLKYKNSQGQFQSADCLKGEDGSAFVVHTTADSGENITLDKTWQEINTAIRETPVILTEESGDSVIYYCEELYVESHTYYVTFKSAHTLLMFSASDPSGYPALEPDRIEFPAIDDEAGEGATDVTFSADKLTTDLFSLSSALNQKQEKPETTGQAGQVLGLALVDGQLVPVWITPASDGVTDVKYNGSSIVTDGVAILTPASAFNIQYENGGGPITPYTQYRAVFYGLASAAGISGANVGNTVGTYPETAKSAISQMLNGAVQVTGTTPVINAKAGIWYVCGECATLDIVAPESGCCDIVFISGSTPTVLTVTSAKANTTIRWANGFDPTALEANTTYEISIKDGELGAALSWT